MLVASGLCVPGAAAATPNDPSFALQWGESNIGQSIPTQTAEGEEPLGPPTSGTPGADDRALAAWSVSTGSRSVVIGELDSGVQNSHPDLEANIWSNPGGVGGCPAGTHGFDALNVDCYPDDEDHSYGGHGTHVAGIMGAVGNNGVGVAGVNWQTSILPVKWVQSAGVESDDLVDALKWLLTAKEEGVNIRVVNDSLTYFGTPYSPEVKSEIEALGAHDILFVTAAGNTANNNDEESVRRYPCGYGLPNEICVTAINNRDELPTWANYGAHTVDLAAPGVSIYSTLWGGRYGYLSGGSMASAQVAGAAALILSVEPTLTAQELKADLLANVRVLPTLKGKVITGGTLDICNAMPGCAVPRRATVTTLGASSLTSTTATLHASVDPNGGEVSDCHFDYGVTSAYGASARCNPMPGHGTRPVEVSASLSGLDPHTSYHFRIVASNAGGTSAGLDQTFTTLPQAPSVTALTSASITQTAVTLEGSVDPNGGEVGSCRFEYGQTSARGESAQCVPMPGGGASPVGVSARLGNLSPNTTYQARLVASNAGGSGGSADLVFTTLPDAPSVVSQAASAVTQTTAMLNATVNPEGAPVSSRQFAYGATTTSGSSLPCVPSPGTGQGPVAVSAAVAGLLANTTYHFRIVAANAGGTGRGADRSLITLPDTPTAVSEAAASVTQTSATLYATVNPNGGTVTGCRFEYGLTASYGGHAPCGSLPGSGETPVAVSASISGLTPDTSYHFRIVASNSGGTGAGADLSFTSLPNAPTVVTGHASEVEGDAATLNALVNPNGAPLNDCRFEYGITAGRGASVPCRLSPGSGTAPVAVSASLTGLTPHTSYRFHIVAANAGGSSEGSDETFMTNTKPVVLTEAVVGATQTSATLRASVNPNGSGASDCHFDYGRSSIYGERAPCTPLPGSATSPVEVSASIGGLAPGSTYHFRIVATNSDGTSAGADQTFITAAVTQLLSSAMQAPALAGSAPGTLVPSGSARLFSSIPALLGRTLTVNSSGLVRVRLACPPRLNSCAGVIVLRIPSDEPQRLASHAHLHRQSGKTSLVPIARARYAIAAGEATAVTLAISSRGRRLLAGRRPLHGQAALFPSDNTGASLSAEVAITLAMKARAPGRQRAH